MSERAVTDPAEHGWKEVDGKWMWGGSGGGSGNGSIQDGNTEGQITTWDGTEWTPEGAVVVSNGNVGIGVDGNTNNRPLKVQDSGQAAYLSVVSDDDKTAGLLLGNPDSDALGRVSYDNALNQLQFFTNSTTQVVIDADGKVVLINLEVKDGRVVRAETSTGICISDGLYPCDDSGALTDGVMNLGGSSAKWADAHFAGDVHITGKLFINGEEVKAGGGGASYTAGNGITIDGDTIKMSGSYSGNLTATDFIAS